MPPSPTRTRRSSPRPPERGSLGAIREKHLDIIHSGVLVDLTRQVGADGGRLAEGLKKGLFRSAVWADHDQAVRQFGIRSVPTVILGGKGIAIGGGSPGG